MMRLGEELQESGKSEQMRARIDRVQIIVPQSAHAGEPMTAC
jgi:hypothetical protein